MRASRPGWQYARLLVPLALAAVAGTGCAETPNKSDEAPRLESLKREGRNASLTVLPVVLGGRPMEPVGEVVGMFLERAGMPNLELGTAPFLPAAEADLAQTAGEFGKFIGANRVETSYALYAEFRGSPGKGMEEVRAVLVNREGELVWKDRQTAQDADFQRIRPQEPMQCVLLLVERLRPVLSLGDPTREDAPEGKLARRWSEKTGLPSDSERSAMAPRAEMLRKAAAQSSLLVFPVLVNEQVSATDGTDLAKAIQEAHLAQATASAEQPRLEVKGAMNEQKMLWDLARGFRQYVRTNKPDADYALYAHYLIGKGGVGAVHFVVCDRAGDWVLVDFQNSHHADFGQVSPRHAGDCGRLVVRRLEGYLK